MNVQEFTDPKVFPLKSLQTIPLSKIERKKLFTLHVQGILWSSSCWVIRCPEQYYSLNWKSVFAAIKSAKVKKLVLDLNERPTILKHIVNIHFTDLKQLWLHGNNIETIETLAFINMDKLICLSISQNHLSNVNSISKCKFQDFTHLYLQKNKNLRFDKIQRCNFRKIYQIVLEEERKDSVVLEDISVLCKIEVQKKAVIRINGRNRIIQQKLYNCLTSGFDECTILICPEILGTRMNAIRRR